jgi:endonuclease G, mitochondrial
MNMMNKQTWKNWLNTLAVVLLVASGLVGQDLVTIKHQNYTTTFSKSKRYPVLVQWETTKAMVGCPTPLKRKDNFKPDPQLVDETNIAFYYVKSGYDRGHVMPAADNLCQTQAVQDECFYFSNMVAQTHRLNAGDWKSLETATRDWALINDRVRVWSGSVGEAKKIGLVSVPTQCWKVIHIPSANKWLAYLFNNDLSNPDGFLNNQVDISVIQKLTGYTFK